MSFRSQRSRTGTASFINYLPPFTMEHTYAMPAYYPYATNPLGEWAYQAEGAYTFKKNTPLGGKYGTTLKVNFSHVHSIKQNFRDPDGQNMGTDGYGSPFWAWGDETFYQDLNFMVDKKLSNSLKLNLMYMNQRYNMTAVEGAGGFVHCDILVGDLKYKLNRKLTLRTEAQYAFIEGDLGDVAYGLVELSYAPHWMVTLSDEYNVGDTKLHYYMGSVTYTGGSHRLQVGYGRTCAGYNCSGGVCRYVPATSGLTVSYNYSF
jgi:hypothetical protein